MPIVLAATFAASLIVGRVGAVGAHAARENVQAVIAQAVLPVMRRYGIPGMAVGVTIGGRHVVVDCGVASKATGRHVDATTLFEIGSITKTFTASLASYAQLTGKLSLSDSVSGDLPSLRGTSFDHVRLVDLGTHTAGGLPLQFPDAVQSDADAMTYYRHWKPSHPAGAYRLYSNPSIMLLGVVTAKRLGGDFITLMQRDVFAPLGLRDTFLVVPAHDESRYAQGYTDAGVPRRMAPGALAAEAYGVRTTASDMLRFLDANMSLGHVEDPLHRAIVKTHTGYDRLGPMTQDMVWEQYRYPASLADMEYGNAAQVVFSENRVAKIEPSSPPRTDVVINKTGSTNGFGAYVAFIPQRKTGIVVLANKAYPIEARVALAYRILERLDKETF